MRLQAAFFYDVKLQFRHGFYYAYLIISTIYIMVLHALPQEFRQTADIILTFSDPGVLGFFFVGGLVLLEKGQNIHDNLFVTPYKPEEYILSKTLSLTALSILTCSVIHLSTFGFHTNLFLYLLGVAMTSFFFTLIGMGLSARCKTINQFFIKSMLYTSILILPLLETIGLWNSPLFYILPAKGSLLLIRSAFTNLSLGELTYAVISLAVWCVVAYFWTRNSIRRYIILKIGGGQN
ncbi:ABC transporter permease [Paenibacillus sp. EC2-1]|uniref:fluoroquinolone export ABC transporter permease subunit n=1 Tax=Paenibacillus sp. EC2-1 TaxID=3388665 RepID=UPI003BEF1F2D